MQVKEEGWCGISFWHYENGDYIFVVEHLSFKPILMMTLMVEKQNFYISINEKKHRLEM